MPDGGEIAAGERVLGDLLDRSHSLRPDELPDVVREYGRRLGAVDAAAYVVDMDQRNLISLAEPGDRLDIDGTLAGRAFRSREAQEGGTTRWEPLLDGADRVGILGVTLPDDVDDALRTRLRWLASIVAELVVTKAGFGDAIFVARRIQPMGLAAELRWALLPPLTFRNDHVEIAAMLEPAYDVAGDAFDYSVSRELVHIGLFDAMGHGLEATRMANLAIAAYRNCRRNGAEIDAIASTIDAVLHGEFGPERFVTGILLTLDPRTGDIRWVCAGHPQPIHLRGTHALGQLAGVVNPPLGLATGTPTVNENRLEVGDRLLLFTDGVVEAESANGDEFGIERLGNLLEHAAMAAEVFSETARRLTHSVLAHAAELRDDATLVLLGWPQAAAQ